MRTTDKNPTTAGGDSPQQLANLIALNPKSDNELMKEVKARSEIALARLHARHSPVLRSVILHVLSSTSEVDEVLQDVFLYVWNHSEAFCEEKGRLVSWIITIARRRSLDRVREKCAYQRATTRFEASLQTVQSSCWIVDREIQQRELRRLIDSHLELLPCKQSEVLRLAYLTGLTQREIAAHLSLPLGTVKTRLCLAVSKLSRSELFRQAA